VKRQPKGDQYLDRPLLVGRLHWTHLLDAKLNWRLQREKPAPLDEPLLVRAPPGNFSIMEGRELQGWTVWVLVSEVREFLEGLP
jgi:hypothetical protein